MEDNYQDEDFCWRCGCLLDEDEEFMGLCDDCIEKETAGLVGFQRKKRFDDEEGR